MNLKYDLKNIDKCEEAAKRFVSEQYDGIKFECFNKEEAQFFHDYMKRNYPEIPVYTTWLEFK